MIPTTTILVAYGRSQTASLTNFNELAGQFSAQIDQPAIPCAIDDGHSPLINAISQALRGGAVRLVILPLFLSPSENKSNAIAEAVTVASRRFPFLQFHLSPPASWQDWLQVANAILDQNAVHDQSRMSVILAVQDNNPEVNADMAKLAHLVYEDNEFGWVQPAYVGENGRPDLPVMLERMKKLGAEKVLVVPWILFAGTTLSQIRSAAMERKETAVTQHLAALPALRDLLSAQHEKALADRSLLPLSWEEVERQLSAQMNTHDKIMPGQTALDEDDYQQLQAKINAILPPRYQDNMDAVSSAPMAAADLIFDDQGDVAWDEIFGFDDPDSPFCELALAGGPSHRGELLEAVTSEACEQEIGKYSAVVAEIERGIQMITGLSTVKSTVPGWVGVQCRSKEMAIWLVRAIIVENVMVRREGSVLYLPAGPHFTLKNEIKSIVTVAAKTNHYWTEHLARLQYSTNTHNNDFGG